MPDNPRIEELRRRVQKDPASIAFAQLAEEYRRAGNYEDAVRVCRTGLAKHPSYLSARVTLGRALIELEHYDEAQTELDYVLRSAPENLAAIRGLAEIYQRRGELGEALKQYQTALGIAKHDPELEESVHELTRQLGPGHPAVMPLPPSTRNRTPADQSPAVTPPPIPIEMPEAGGAFPTTSDMPRVEDAPQRETFEPPGPVQPPAPALSPELEAAADEFTRALEALDAITIDLPTSSLGSDAFDLPEGTPAEEERLVLARDWKMEGFETVTLGHDGLPADVTTEKDRRADVIDTPPLAERGPEADALEELESWLENIVAHRADQFKTS